MRRADAALLALLACATGCSKPEPGEPVRPRALVPISAPLEDPGAWCSDLRGVRLCFAEPCPGGVCVFPRSPVLEYDAEYRCTGSGSSRRCRPRRELASPFVCVRDRCVQQYPRLPDDGEWECVDSSGAVLCRGGQQPAGVARARQDAGWWCGQRRGTPRERLCLDVDPDLPTRAAASWRCAFRQSGARAARICEPANAPRLGDTCRTREDCPAGAQCVRNACIPRAPTPNCWTDADCEPGRCELGLCSEGAG